jgi:Leucine-rich repeat (LRR) protein
MRLSSIHPQWVVDAAKRINPQVASGNIGLHPVLKTITRLDISGNALNKLPLIIFQLPSLKVLNISENSINSLPTLHNGRVRVQLGNGSGNSMSKKYHSCDNITDRVIEEEEDSDFTYAESSWNCPHLEEIEMHHNSLTTLPTCVFELPTLRFLNAAYNDIDSLPFAMWFSPMLKTLDLKGNYLKTLPLTEEIKKKTVKAVPKISTLPRPRHISKSRDDLNKE